MADNPAFADPDEDADDQPDSGSDDADSNALDGDVIDTPDGGALVKLSDKPERETPGEAAFFENLVETDALGFLELQRLTLAYIDNVALDRQARESRDKQYADGIKRTGFSDEKVSGADFEGASKVMHPMIGKAAVDFAAKVMKELFPPDGPCKDKVVGKVTPKKVERARRKTAHMNWQLTEQMPEFRGCLEQLESQVPIGGAQYLKIFYDRQLKRPSCDVYWIDNMVLPYSAKNFLAARRRTYVLRLTEEEFQRRVSSGEYVDPGRKATGMEPEQTKSEKATEKVEGNTQTSLNEDGLRHMFEGYVWLDADDPEAPEGYSFQPYVLVVDDLSQKAVALYRNWDPDRADRTGVVDELQHVVEFGLIPWRGAYPLGLFHLIGGLSTAATGALRALLDSALLNNSSTLLKLKSQVGGQSQKISQTGIQEVEGAVSMDDIRKLAMPLPFNPPSEVLYQLLGFLSDQAADMIRTSLDNTSDSGAEVPVGTTMANLEQGMTVFSSIHARHHASMAQVLKILHRINRDWLTEEVVKEDTGELLALPDDYQGPMDVVPVSDPRIFSEAQRFAQVQAIAQRAAMNPLYNQAKVEMRILDTLKVPNPDELLATPPEPEPADPVTENVAMALGKPASAFPNQNHSAHLLVHLKFALDPNLGLNLLVGPSYIQLMLTHLKEHLILWYAKMMGETVQRALKKKVPIARLVADESPKTADALARAFAVASQYVQAPEAELQTFAKVTQGVKQLMAFAQQVAQMQQPQDPNMALAQAANKDVDRKAAADQGKQQLEQAKLQQKAGTDQAHVAIEGQRLQTDAAVRAADSKTRALSAQGDVQRESAAAQAEAVRQAGETQVRQQELALAVNRQTSDAAQGQLELKLDAEQADKDRQLEAAKLHASAAGDAADRHQDAALTDLQERVKQAMNTADNETALRITLLELANDHRMAKLKTGHGIGKNPSP